MSLIVAVPPMGGCNIMNPNRNRPMTFLNVQITAKPPIIYQLSTYVNGSGISQFTEYLWHDLILLGDFACLLEPLHTCSCFPGEDLLLLCCFYCVLYLATLLSNLCMLIDSSQNTDASGVQTKHQQPITDS